MGIAKFEDEEFAFGAGVEEALREFMIAARFAADIAERGRSLMISNLLGASNTLRTPR